MSLLSTSPASLDPQGTIRRLPRASSRRRPSSFYERFEDRVLLYDLFWNADRTQILGIGPAPLNLAPLWAEAEATTCPNSERLSLSIEVSRSAMLLRLDGAPATAEEVTLTFAGRRHVLRIQRSMVDPLRGRRLLMAINKDNPLRWIDSWARFHAVHHGVDAVVIFDNGSTAYGPADIDHTLSEIPQLATAFVLSMPFRFGPYDRSVVMHRFYSLFLQICCMTLAIHRFGLNSAGIINCDIDELVAPVDSGTIFDRAAASAEGLIKLKGQWVEPVITTSVAADSASHRDFTAVSRWSAFHYCPEKWVLDPSRLPADRAAFAYWHDIKPKDLLRVDETHAGRFFHYRGINTNWKQQRRQLSAFSSLRHVMSQELSSAWERVPITDA